MPTIHEVRANGTVVLPDLHLDIHVFSDIPKDRFVFINMSKHREDSRLAEGPMVEEITPEGVVLEYSGTSFLLPRE
ncbi:MAG: general secretion pathway protein GspB [Gammaproteobacteria bacterium]|nr:general secretion pathway protein GspB [Gammaproteobacteria bacterium]